MRTVPIKPGEEVCLVLGDGRGRQEVYEVKSSERKFSAQLVKATKIVRDVVLRQFGK